jgi:hypothetical protein
MFEDSGESERLFLAREVGVLLEAVTQPVDQPVLDF